MDKISFKKWRKKNGFSQQQAADVLGLKRRMIQYYEKGKKGWFTKLKGDYVEIEILGLYWHFVDLVWVFIFAFFYLW